MFNQEMKIIDLFSGAGGLTAGFVILSGYPYHPVWANDFNKYAVDTYNLNFGGHCVVGDIIDILAKKPDMIPKADIVIGGPPCQGFSLLNKNRDGDPRKSLWMPFMEIVSSSGAEYFVMENVPQLLNTAEHTAILQKAAVLGFKTWSGVLKAVDYGVPQSRKRAFIVGAKDRDPRSFFPPKRTHFDPTSDLSLMERELCGYDADARPFLTVRDAIGNLPPPQGTEIREASPPLNLHFGRTPTEKSLKRYKSIPEQGMNRFDLLRNAPELTPDCWVRKKKGGTDLFGRLWWDRPSFTIRTEFYKPEKGRYLHPEQHRPITHREAARLQTFPDSFLFSGTKIEIAKQIGNAVPPQLAAVVARTVFLMANASLAEYA
jgi:DNA (cytosine-5)-methyltransferase 1